MKYRPEEIEAMRTQSDPELYPDVDWQKLLMNKVSPLGEGERQHLGRR